MHWEVVVGERVSASLAVEVEFLDWLRPRVKNSSVSQLDPFRDATLDAGSQQVWLVALREVWSGLQTEIRNRVERTAGLPRAVGARELVVARLVDRAVRVDSMAGILRDLIAVFELALENNAVIKVFGD